MSEYVFGANILENLTVGMYRDSRVIFREYIQNACDAIDKAQNSDLDIFEDEEPEITISIDEQKNLITVEDNGIGISAREFKTLLTNVAQSDKDINIEKGFRGIGRFCGAAYCKQLRFTATAKGEGISSIMTIDAKTMSDNFYNNDLKITAQELLEETLTFETIQEDWDKHGFKVELIDVNKENLSLLDYQIVKDYLSMVAPLPYSNAFPHKEKIYDHAAALGMKIDEYKIVLNDEQLFKPYRASYRAGSGAKNINEIFDCDFRDFTDDSGKFIGWGWVGLSDFSGIIKPEETVRSIRLRKHNIQIGDENTLLTFFKEERGIHYFIGEIFACDKNLIPNARRDDFIENVSKTKFYKKLKRYFDELHMVYISASKINSSKNKIIQYSDAVASFSNKLHQNQFKNAVQFADAKNQLRSMSRQAETAAKKLEKYRKDFEFDSESALGKVIKNLIPDKIPFEQIKQLQNDIENSKYSFQARAQNLSRLDSDKQNLVQQIYDIIYETVDETTREKIILKIEEAFRA